MSVHDLTPKQVAAAVKDHFRNEGIKQSDLAAELGITKGTLSGHLSGKKYISSELAAVLSEKYGFNIEFLVAGKGRLFGEKETEIVKQFEDDMLKLLEENFDLSDGKPAEVGDVIECLDRDVPTILITNSRGEEESHEINTVYVHKDRPRGERISFLYYEWTEDDELGEEQEFPFGQLSLADAMNLYGTCIRCFKEDKIMGKMGEMAYRFRNRTKRKDDTSLISIKRASDGLILLDINDELLNDDGLARFVGRLVSQELNLGVYPEYKLKYSLIFGWLSVLYSHGLSEEIMYEKMEEDIDQLCRKLHKEHAKMFEEKFKFPKVDFSKIDH